MKTAIFAALAGAMLVAAPGQATVLLAGSSLQPTQPFSAIAATQGTLLASVTRSGTAFTFSATVTSAVYRNSLGTLDFYYQVQRTGAGSRANQQIDELTAADFGGFLVDAYASAGDPDGAGLFLAAMNPPSSTTTFGRSLDDSVIKIDFGSNGLIGTERSATYVLRTNARAYSEGTFGVIDGSTFADLAFQPAAVPEPATWGLMIAGFGMVGFAARRKKLVVTA